MDPWIARMCRRSCLWQVRTWGAILVMGIAFAAYHHRYISNFVQGPLVVSAADLAIRDADATRRYFLRVTGTKVVGTGVREISIRKRNGREISRSTSAEYFAVLVGDKGLFVRRGFGTSSVKGYILPGRVW